MRKAPPCRKSLPKWLTFLSMLLVTAQPNFASAAGTYSETFDSNTAPNWSTPVSTFTATGGYFTNTDHSTGLAIAVYDGATWNTDFTYSADLDAEFGGGPANTVGVIYNYQDTSNYYEVKFAPNTSTATLIGVVGGTTTILATATYAFPVHTFVTVKVSRSGSNTTVLAGGSAVFSAISQGTLAAGKIGVLQEWNYAKFDNVAVAVTTPAYSQTFDSNTAANWSAPTSTFAATGGYYTNTDHNTNLAMSVYDGATWSTDFTYSVDVDAEFGGGSANTVGVIYNYRDPSNYYEVKFAPNTSIASLISVINGSATVLSTATYAFPLHTFVTVKVGRNGANSTIFANGAPVLSNVTQTGLGAGKIGVLEEWNYAKFDNVSVTGGPVPYATNGPPFPRLGTVRIGGEHNYQDSTVQQELARVHVALLGYWKGWDNSRGTTMNQVVQTVKSQSPNQQYPTKVFLYINNGEFSDDRTVTTAELTSKLNSMGASRTSSWWLLDNAGSRVISPYNSTFHIVNTSPLTPADGGGENWLQWYANWVYTNFYQPNPAIDGFFTDNVGWRPRQGINGDWNLDGTAEAYTDPNAGTWFRQGYRDHFNRLRQLMPAKYQIANLGDWGEPAAITTPEYTNAVDGGLFEKIIGASWSVETQAGGWSDAMTRYHRVMSLMGSAKLLLFGQSAEEMNGTINYQTVRYGLASCLMDDGYYAFSFSEKYEDTLHFDEFDVALGYPIEAPPTSAWQNGVYKREFQNGIVVVNPKGNHDQVVTVGAGFAHFSGTQDPIVNNGAAVTSVTIKDRDGLILIRHP